MTKLLFANIRHCDFSSSNRLNKNYGNNIKLLILPVPEYHLTQGIHFRVSCVITECTLCLKDAANSKMPDQSLM